MIRLLLTDVDGTLIGTGSQILPLVLKALERAREAGLHLAVCTGRPLFSRAAEYAALVSGDEPHIFQNGAHVAYLNGQTIHRSVLRRDSYNALVAVSRRVGIALEVYTEGECFVELHTEIAEEHQRLIEIPARHQDLLSLEAPILRAQWVHTRAQLPLLEAEMRAIPDIQYASAGTPDMPDALFTGATRLGTSKLEGACALARHYGVTLQETMMVGDGDNDIEIIQGVGFGVAMGNGSPGVKRAARRIVGNVDDGGLAEAIALALETHQEPSPVV